MGDSPQVVKIACPGCNTQFRLKPKKGRLPKKPVPCPKCAERIPVTEENIRPAELGDEGTAPGNVNPGDMPAAAKLGRKQRSGTVAGTPLQPPSEPSDEGEQDFDDLIVPGLSDKNPNSTFLGMGSALSAIESKRARSDKTAVVDDDTLAQVRSESSVVEDDEAPSSEADRASLRQTTENRAVTADPSKDFSDPSLRETSEKEPLSQQLLAELSADEQDEEEPQEEEPKQAPKSAVLGKIKIKKKLARVAKKRKAKRDEAEDKRPEPDADDTEVKKPSLSALLKRARDRKDKLKLPQAQTKANEDTGEPEDLDNALDALADETAKALSSDSAISDAHDDETIEQPVDLPSGDADGDEEPWPEYESGESNMIRMLRKRVAENQQPGAASERRGSGYIRLPTAEIQDVLGQGTYRLRVEDIVYEPVDKKGLTQLIKRGVLLGAEQIADADGDWMPIGEHPVFKELRRKMAREAHDLLAQYGKGAEEAELPIAAAANLPASTEAELPVSRPADLPRSAGTDLPTSAGASDFDDLGALPEPDAELEAEAMRAAEDLFADSEPEEVHEDAPRSGAGSAPPPMPGSSGTTAPPETPRQEAPPEASQAAEEQQADPFAGFDEPEETYTVEAPAYEDPGPREQAEPAAPGKSKRWVPALLVLLVIGGIAAFAFSPAGKPYIDQLLAGADSEAQQPAADQTPETQPEPAKPAVDIGEAVESASSTVAEAAALDPNTPELQQRVADSLYEAGEFSRAADILGVLWSSRQDDAALTTRYANTLLEAERFGEAAAVAVEGMQMPETDTDFEALFEKAITSNPRLGEYEFVDITPGEHAEHVSGMREGKRIVFELHRDGQPNLLFKPSQTGWERGWRANIAAWRLCQMMTCKFEVPSTRPARISRADFEQLSSELDQRFADRLDDLEWQRDDQGEYLYGSLQTRLDASARFPIEVTSLWRPWLSTGSSTDFDQPASEALSELEDVGQGFYEPLAAQLDDEPLSQVAAQLSSVLLFDYLTNNWDRFRNGEENWGTNLHFADGDLVSRDNGTTFQPRASSRVKGRFSWTARFSADTVTSLRAMTPELAEGRLFPNASAGERAELEVFWDQREKALERIDELIEAQGTKEALAFE